LVEQALSTMQGNIASLRALHFDDDRKTNHHHVHPMSSPMTTGRLHSSNYHYGPYPHSIPSHQIQPQQLFHSTAHSVPRSPRSPLSPMSPNGLSSPTFSSHPLPPKILSKKISQFIIASSAKHNALQTTCSSEGRLEIVILKGGLPSRTLLYIQQHCQYQVRYSDHRKTSVLLATIPQHLQIPFTFNSVAAFTQYIVNKNFIRFRDRPPTQTLRVSLWRIYQFPGEQNLFNIWAVTKMAQKALGEYGKQPNHGKGHSVVHIQKKTKNYHLAAHQVSMQRVNKLSEEVMKRIFSFLNGSRFHVWIHIHEVVDRAYHRSNLLGLEFHSSTNDVYVMRRSAALLKKVMAESRAKDGCSGIMPSVFKKSVTLLKAEYGNE